MFHSSDKSVSLFAIITLPCNSHVAEDVTGFANRSGYLRHQTSNPFGFSGRKNVLYYKVKVACCIYLTIDDALAVKDLNNTVSVYLGRKLQNTNGTCVIESK